MTPIPVGYIGGIACELARDGRYLVIRPTVLAGIVEKIGELDPDGETWLICPCPEAEMAYRALHQSGRVQYLGRSPEGWPGYGRPRWRLG